MTRPLTPEGAGMSNVVDLKLVEVGSNYRFQAETILEAAKSNSYSRLVIIGELEDGSLYVAGTANGGESLILLERARHLIAFGREPG